jgi:SAM-dependent methyltransferase
MNNYVEYYKKLKIPPTESNYSSRAEYEDSRRFLYACLGCVYESLTGKSIIEFGPGLGQNLALIANFQPDKLAFADHLDSVLFKIPKLLLDNGMPPQKINSYKVDINCDDSDWIEVFGDVEFDVVIAEGVVNGNPNPEKIYFRLSKLVKKGGVFIGTGVHYFGSCDQIFRRFWYPLYINNFNDTEITLSQLISDYADGLRILGTKKAPRDWVLDNIVNPLVGSSGSSSEYFYSAGDVASMLAKSSLSGGAEFLPLGLSPKITLETTWFKHFGSRVTSIDILNNFSLEFEKRATVFLDSQACDLELMNEESSAALSKCIIRLFEFAQMGYENPSTFRAILNSHRVELQGCLNVIAGVLGEGHALTAVTRDFGSAIGDYVETGVVPQVPDSIRAFHSRGLHYFSFYRMA